MTASRDGATERLIRRGPYPELTWTSVLVGYGLGILITVSIGYASLILGFSIEGSEVAAILGFGILRGLLGRSSIVENNINQTIASGVNAASADGYIDEVNTYIDKAREQFVDSLEKMRRLKAASV